VDYAKDSDEERMAFKMISRESELVREVEIIREQAERRCAIALVEACMVREMGLVHVVTLEQADLIDLSED
jgi:hypothetical protein